MTERIDALLAEPRIRGVHWHDAAGEPAPLPVGEQVAPKFPAEPLVEMEVRSATTPARWRWRWQDWAVSNGRQNLHRPGGYPARVQSARYPPCPGCGRTMGFLIQFDSELPTAGGEEWLWGSGGLGCGFWCDLYRISGFLWQCT